MNRKKITIIHFSLFNFGYTIMNNLINMNISHFISNNFNFPFSALKVKF